MKWLFAWIALILIVGAGMWIGCSLTQRKWWFLSFVLGMIPLIFGSVFLALGCALEKQKEDLKKGRDIYKV
jgi:hypothetical protein